MASKIHAILLDMDGVLFHGNRALPGAREFLYAIRDVPHVFVTNNPIRSASEIVTHLRNLDLGEFREDQVLTSAVATASWLQEQSPGYGYFAVGEGDLHDALAVYGRPDEEQADYVVVGEGEGLDYASLVTGIRLIGNGATLISTNPDASVDGDCDGQHCVKPGGGALVAPFEVATGQKAITIGKPNPLLYQMAMQRLGGVAAENCLMIGDRPDTDIVGAKALGMMTALVRTGRFWPGKMVIDEQSADIDVVSLIKLLSSSLYERYVDCSLRC